MIEVQHLTRRYGEHTAVCDLSFTIESGHIYGLLGPNGAGKSTTMNMMTGCLAASEGTVTIDGYDIFENPREAKRLVGYLPELPPVYPDMTVREYLGFVARAKSVSKQAAAAQIEHAMAVTQTAEYADRLIRHLSKGYRQRVGIAQALLGEPSVVILDEPTVGLDPKQIIEIRDLIRSLGKEHTVILSSHILAEVRAVCDRILILSHGRLAANDTPEALERLFAGSSRLELTLAAGEARARAVLKNLPAAKAEFTARGDGETDAVLTAEGQGDLRRDAFFACCEARVPILRMEHSRASLEQVFLELTSDGEERSPEDENLQEKED